MSQTLNMNAMVAKVQYKTAIGIPSQACADFLNEAFRKVNQMSKGGFIWQFRQTTVTVAAGAQADIALPGDFDAGKTAILRGNGTTGFGATSTMIPYVPMKEWVNQENFQAGSQVLGNSLFSSWTYVPNFVNGITSSFPFVMKLGPQAAYPTGGGTLPFFYHAMNPAPIPLGTGFFPTPDQFDSMIVDLAIADAEDVYSLHDGGKSRMTSAMQSITEIIDTYRTDRYDLAGVSDQMAQAQEKTVEKAK